MDNNDYSDPFNAGQMVGMLVTLSFIEKNGGIPEAVLQKIKGIAADKAQVYFNKPTEDIFLMIDDLVSEMQNL